MFVNNTFFKYNIPTYNSDYNFNKSVDVLIQLFSHILYDLFHHPDISSIVILRVDQLLYERYNEPHKTDLLYVDNKINLYFCSLNKMHTTPLLVILFVKFFNE